MIELFNFNLTRTEVACYITKPCVKYIPKTSQTENSLIHRSTYIYNKIPEYFQTLNERKFVKEIKLYMNCNFQQNKIPKIGDL